MNSKVNLNSCLTFIGHIEEGDDEEEAKKIIEKFEKFVLKEKQKSNKIDNLTTKITYEKNFEKINDVFEEYLKYGQETKNVSQNTFKEYQTGFKYFFLYYDRESKIYELEDIDKFLNFRDFLTKLPKNFMRRYKENDDVNELIEKMLSEDKRKGIETEFLSPKTINKHFMTYNDFLNFLVFKKKIKSNPLEKMKQLNTEENPYENFTETELKTLFQKTENKEIRDFLNTLLYTGMRLSAVLRIKKDNINLENETITITDDKTINGKRIISIHKNILNIFKDYKKSEREHFFFDTDKKDLVQKRVNRHIKKILNVRKTIHSLRGNFTSKLFKLTEDINLRKYIVGHSQVKDITFSIYNQEEIDLKKMKRVINKVQFEKDNKKIEFEELI